MLERRPVSIGRAFFYAALLHGLLALAVTVQFSGKKETPSTRIRVALTYSATPTDGVVTPKKTDMPAPVLEKKPDLPPQPKETKPEEKKPAPPPVKKEEPKKPEPPKAPEPPKQTPPKKEEPKKPEPKIVPPELKKPEPKKEEPKKVEEKKPEPKKEEPPKPEPKKEEPKKEEKKEPEPPPPPLVRKPEPPKEPEKKPEPKPEPKKEEPKKEEPKKEEPKKADPLKDMEKMLQKEQEKTKSDATFDSIAGMLQNAPSKKAASGGAPQAAGAGEADIIKTQIVRNWTVPLALKGQNVAVEVAVRLRRDGSIITVTDIGGSRNDPRYPTLRDSVHRAIYRSAPFMGLPDNTYEGSYGWNTVRITFTPSDLGY